MSGLNHKEKVWCKRFQQTMREKPKGLEIYHMVDEVLTLRKGTVEQSQKDNVDGALIGLFRLLDERALFSIDASIYNENTRVFDK